MSEQRPSDREVEAQIEEIRGVSPVLLEGENLYFKIALPHECSIGGRLNKSASRYSADITQLSVPEEYEERNNLIGRRLLRVFTAHAKQRMATAITACIKSPAQLEQLYAVFDQHLFTYFDLDTPGQPEVPLDYSRAKQTLEHVADLQKSVAGTSLSSPFPPSVETSTVGGLYLEVDVRNLDTSRWEMPESYPPYP